MWNPTNQINKIKPSVDRLVAQLATKGVTFSPSDGELNNVVFQLGDTVVKIAHASFYRFYGIACVYKETDKKNEIVMVEVTDDMFMDKFMKPIVETLLGIKTK